MSLNHVRVPLLKARVVLYCTVASLYYELVNLDTYYKLRVIKKVSNNKLKDIFFFYIKYKNLNCNIKFYLDEKYHEPHTFILKISQYVLKRERERERRKQNMIGPSTCGA